tara:strand:+ start:62 stop:259 length:198 start_codon:yes stop_codon:yes gene_type:complete
MLRYSCLVIGVLFALIVLTALLTCRLTGFPVSGQPGAGPTEPSSHELGMQGFPGVETTSSVYADL